MCLYPVFEHATRVSGKTTGEFLAAFVDELETAADTLGLTPLSAFADSRPVPEGFDGDPDELEELMGPCQEWFEPADGQQAVAALLDGMEADPEAFQLDDAREGVECELRDLAGILRQAASESVRFRLELS
jgi:hypothetical protein